MGLCVGFEDGKAIQLYVVPAMNRWRTEQYGMYTLRGLDISNKQSIYV